MENIFYENGEKLHKLLARQLKQREGDWFLVLKCKEV